MYGPQVLPAPLAPDDLGGEGVAAQGPPQRQEPEGEGGPRDGRQRRHRVRDRARAGQEGRGGRRRQQEHEKGKEAGEKRIVDAAEWS